MKKRVGIIALLQESNTFLTQRTTLAHFEQDTLAVGDEVRQQFCDAHHEVGGFFAALEAGRCEAVPIFAARAMPFGVMTAETLSNLMEMIRDGMQRAGPLDGVLVAPHGATVSETIVDVDGYWLSEVRTAVGTDCPIIGTIDPHANLSPAMVSASDALIAYRTNPHVDQWQRGFEAGQLMCDTLSGKVWPTQAAAFPPLAINIECQNPEEDPCRAIFQAAEETRSMPNVLAASICLGFPYADVPEMGAAALVITDRNREESKELALQLGTRLWQSREHFVPELLGIDSALDAVQALVSDGALDAPACLLDMGDNVGAGSPADSTHLALAIQQRKIPRAFVCINDPAAVSEAISAPIGSRFVLSIGGETNADCGSPFSANFALLGIYDGKFSESQARHGGKTTYDQGRTAILRTDEGLTVMVTSTRMAPRRLEQLRSCGLDPKSFRILVAKGVHSPIAAYQEVCGRFFRVNTPGPTSADLSAFSYRERRRPMYPFEPQATWSAN